MRCVIFPRPSGFDELGLRRALPDRTLLMLIAAMALLAALAMAGWFSTAALSLHWQQGAASLTVQVPRPAEPAAHADQMRLKAVLTVLLATPEVASAHVLSDQELTDLLTPWLGQGKERLAIPMPAVIAVSLTHSAGNLGSLSQRLVEAASGTVIEDDGRWINRVAALVRGLRACAGLALLLVAAVAAAVTAIAMRAGLSTRREAIEIIHGLGATDGYIASHFAARATSLAMVGAAAGAVLALPILLMLAWMAGRLMEATGASGNILQGGLNAFPAGFWLALFCLPFGAAAIGFTAAQSAVRQWLRRLP